MNVFDLVAKITLDPSEYEERMKKTEKNTKSFASKLGSGLGTAAKVSAAAVAAVGAAAVAAGGALLNAAGSVAEYGDNIDKMSQKLGISAQAYQEWDAIIQHSGTSIDSMQRGMVTLSKAAESGKDAFEKLGISQTELATLNQEELFARTIQGLQGMEQGTERTALAQELLGGSAKELGPLLNMTAEETEQMRQRVHELGGVMSDEAVKAAAAYQDSLQDMKTALQGVSRNIISEFLPGITMVMDGLTELFAGGDGMEQISEGVSMIADKITEATPKVLEAGSKIVLSVGKAITDNLPTLLSSGSEFVLTVASGIVQGLPNLLSSGLDIVLKVAHSISENLPELVSAAVDAVIGFGNYLVDNAGEVAHGAVEIMTSLGEALITNIPKLLIAVPQIAYELLTALLTEFKNMLGVTGDFLVDGIDTIGAEATYMAGLQGQNTGIAFGEGSVDGASGASGDVSGSWTGLISGAGSESEILAGYYGNTTGEAFDSGTVSGIQGSAGEVSGAARGAVTGAISSARGAAGGAVGVGQQIGSGIASGIQAMIQRVASAASDLVGKAIEAAKARAAIHSPSRVARDEIGKQLGLGVAEGMVSKDVLTALDKSAAELTGDTVKDLETMVKAWDGVYKNYYEGLEHQNFFLELAGDTDGIIANYRKMQETLHEQKEHYLRMGVDANDSAIRDMEEQWWDYQDKIEKVYSNNYSNLVSSLEHSLWLSEQQGGDPETRIKILTKLMEQAHARADELRAQGYAEDSKEIMELQKDWWGWYNEIADINEDIADGIAKDSKDAFDGVISGLEHSLFLTEKNGGKSTEKIAILEKLMAETHKRADELREQGFDETSKEIMDLQKEWWGYHDELEGINDGIIKKFQEIADAAQEAYDKAFDAIMDKQKTMQDKLAGYGELYKSTVTTSGKTYVSLQDLDRQTKQLERYGEIIEELRSRGVSGNLMEDILGMGIDEGSEFGKRLLNMSEGGLNDYLASYQRKQDIAADISARYYKPEFDALNGQNVELNVAEQRNLEYNEEQTSLLRRIAETFEGSGGQTVQVVVDGQVIANATFDDIVAVSKMRGLDIVNVKEG